jgi:uncharacterized damage-inducible protein DinB
MKQLFLNLFEYDFWANSRTFNSLNQFDNPRAKIVEVFSHIINSQLIWLARVKQHPIEHANPWKVYQLKECSDLLQKSNREWISFINNLSPGSEDSEIFYKNAKGEEYEIPLFQPFALSPRSDCFFSQTGRGNSGSNRLYSE